MTGAMRRYDCSAAPPQRPFLITVWTTDQRRTLGQLAQARCTPRTLRRQSATTSRVSNALAAEHVKTLDRVPVGRVGTRSRVGRTRRPRTEKHETAIQLANRSTEVLVGKEQFGERFESSDQLVDLTCFQGFIGLCCEVVGE